jgi:3-dehydroquinate synthase
MNEQKGERVRVKLEHRSYEIVLEVGGIDRVGEMVAELEQVRHAVLLTDENVEKPYADRVAESLASKGITVDLLVVEPGEVSKSVETATSIWEKTLEVGTDRKSLVLAVGGGVIGDLAGFIAATYARGIRFFQVPTTLLAQVDSSVGGKVGINLPKAKNMIGAFHQPIGVMIDPTTLDTLDMRQYRAGLGEVVKYGISLDAALFEELENNTERLNQRDHELLGGIIAWCCRIKGDIVRQDERETLGLRALLNYGHTFGHAFENLAGYGTLLHGEAVAIGMLCTAVLARLLGRVDRDWVDRQRRLLEALHLETKIPDVSAEQVLQVMMRDKKTQHGKLRLVLPTTLGHCELVDQIEPEWICRVLEELS